MERNQTRCGNILMDFANLFKAFIGVNYLSIAFAIGQSGIALGIIGLLLIATATVHGCHLLIKCKRVVIRNILEDTLPASNLPRDDANSRRLLSGLIEKHLSYGDVAFLTFGKVGTALVNFSLVVTQFGFCVNYFIFLGNTFDQMFPMFMTYIDILKSNRTDSDVTTGFIESAFGNDFPHPITDDTSTPANILPYSLISKSPGYNVLVVIPLPLFILFGYMRSVRHMGPASVIANVSVFIGYVAMLSYLLTDFAVSDTVKWFNFSTFPVFFGQVTASYEGIGTIIPIESSMEGNRHLFATLLYLAMVLFTFVLGSMGFLGYLRFGESTAQVIIWNLASGSILELVVGLVVCVGVIFTFPLQIFPVIEIFEELLFLPGKCCGPPLIEQSDDSEGMQHDDDSINVEFSRSSQGEMQSLLGNSKVADILTTLPFATQIPQSVSTWKRNILRTFIVLCQLGCAYALRNQFAYFSALTGAIGSTLLAFVIPSLLHLKLKASDSAIPIIIKDIGLIIFGIVGGVAGVYSSVLSIINNQ